MYELDMAYTLGQDYVNFIYCHNNSCFLGIILYWIIDILVHLQCCGILNCGVTRRRFFHLLKTIETLQMLHREKQKRD